MPDRVKLGFGKCLFGSGDGIGNLIDDGFLLALLSGRGGTVELHEKFTLLISDLLGDIYPDTDEHISTGG